MQAYFNFGPEGSPEIVIKPEDWRAAEVMNFDDDVEVSIGEARGSIRAAYNYALLTGRDASVAKTFAFNASLSALMKKVGRQYKENNPGQKLRDLSGNQLLRLFDPVYGDYNPTILTWGRWTSKFEGYMSVPRETGDFTLAGTSSFEIGDYNWVPDAGPVANLAIRHLGGKAIRVNGYAEDDDYVYKELLRRHESVLAQGTTESRHYDPPAALSGGSRWRSGNYAELKLLPSQTMAVEVKGFK